MRRRLDIVIFGLSLSSSWGNGHATTYRALMRALTLRGHRALFLERDVPWYAAHRDLPTAPHGSMHLYKSIAELKRKFRNQIRNADLCIVGSFVPEGVEVAEWVIRTATGVKAFYDIDTPITLAKLRSGDREYLTRDLVEAFDLYLSFAGGPVLSKIERVYGARMARPLYCSVDPLIYYYEDTETQWDLGYMGTYSRDRQQALDLLLLQPARSLNEFRMIVAGPLYPPDLRWPGNVEHIDHIAPDDHRRFYNSQRYTLNLTRLDMIEAGYSPSVRLFEAAACGTPIISDYWKGLETFFEPGSEILIADKDEDVVSYLRDLPESERQAIGKRARQRVLAEHTAIHRVTELESYIEELLDRRQLLSESDVLTGAVA
jgi:spore maturation protein CgeB